jgi:hypothetical protein
MAPSTVQKFRIVSLASDGLSVSQIASWKPFQLFHLGISHSASYELVWRGGEACNCLLSYFEEEFDNYGNPTGRIAYNPIFSKTAQGGSHRLTEKRWLVQNTIDPNKCPIRYLI